MSLLHVTKRVHSEIYNESETSFVNKFILKKDKDQKKDLSYNVCLVTLWFWYWNSTTISHTYTNNYNNFL